jgi:hypothetical protein
MMVSRNRRGSCTTSPCSGVTRHQLGQRLQTEYRTGKQPFRSESLRQSARPDIRTGFPASRQWQHERNLAISSSTSDEHLHRATASVFFGSDRPEPPRGDRALANQLSLESGRRCRRAQPPNRLLRLPRSMGRSFVDGWRGEVFAFAHFGADTRSFGWSRNSWLDLGSSWQRSSYWARP